MKLLTRLANYRITTIPPKNVKDVEGAMQEIKHDAAAAHALMRAIHNRIDRARDAGEPDAARRLECIIQYADEIMREWGFDSGEVPE